MPIDVFKRLTPTPHKHWFNFGGAVIEVVTNSQRLTARLLGEFALPEAGTEHSPSFTWKVVVEDDDGLDREVESLTNHMSQDGLTLVTIGQKNCFACDRQTSLGVSFVSQSFVENEALFRQFLLPVLSSLP
jgi:hypothetical protein